MSRNEELRERYEDALFALLMDEVAVSEGQKALEENERLKESKEVQVSEDLSRRCHKVIAKTFAGKNLRTFGHGFSRVIGKVAIVAMVGVLLFTTAFATMEEFRVKTLNFVMEVFDDRTEIRMVPDDGEGEFGDNHDITAGWLPEGFEFEKEDRSAFDVQKVCSNGERRIWIKIFSLEGNVMNLDTENADIENVLIRDYAAMVISKEHYVTVFWTIENEGIACTAFGKDISAADLTKVAENLTIK